MKYETVLSTNSDLEFILNDSTISYHTSLEGAKRMLNHSYLMYRDMLGKEVSSVYINEAGNFLEVQSRLGATNLKIKYAIKESL